LNYFQKLIFN